jgi:hypothetical protein
MPHGEEGPAPSTAAGSAPTDQNEGGDNGGLALPHAPSSSSFSRHRNSSGGSSSSINSSNHSSGVDSRRTSSSSSSSSVSCGGVVSLARSSWSIQEDAGDEEEEDEDEEGDVSHGGRSRDTSSASVSAFLPSFVHAHLDLDMPPRPSTASSCKAARASTSTVASSHDHPHARQEQHTPQQTSGGRLGWLRTWRPSSSSPPGAAHARPPPRRRVTVVSPALAQFRAKLQAATRTALAAGMTAATSQFVWEWSAIYSWFSVTLCISGTRQSLGETLALAIDFWRGVTLLVPLLLLIRAVRGHPAFVAVGLFLAVVAIIAYPGMPDASKRMAAILLALVVLAGESNPDLRYYKVAADLLLTLFMANVFSVAALLFPLPTAALALLDARRQLKTLRHRLGSLLRGFDHAFGLGEEVHHSVLEQVRSDCGNDRSPTRLCSLCLSGWNGRSITRCPSLATVAGGGDPGPKRDQGPAALPPVGDGAPPPAARGVCAHARVPWGGGAAA